MSIMVVHLVPQGLLFGADRNITSQVKRQDGGVAITVEGQSQRPKVLKWPNREAIIGYVGAAEIAGMPTDLWLYHSFCPEERRTCEFLGRVETRPDDVRTGWRQSCRVASSATTSTSATSPRSLSLFKLSWTASCPAAA